jgi:radical SAM protein with 4Fe4S-binding SPASM domain
VDPTGQVLPCSSFERGIGSLLDEDYDAITSTRAARYWKSKAFLPPVCAECVDADVCAGGCPLYWDEVGSFSEIPRPGADSVEDLVAWQLERARGGSFGVVPPEVGAGSERLPWLG